MPIIVQRYTIAEDVQSVPQAKPAGTGGDPLLELLAAADKRDHDADLPTTPTFSERRDGEHVSSLGGVRGGAGLTVEVEFGSSPDSVSAPTAARPPVVEGNKDSSEHQSDDDCGRAAPSAESVNADDDSVNADDNSVNVDGNSVAAMERWPVATVDEDDFGDDDIEGSGHAAVEVFQASVAADADVHAQTMGQEGGKIAVYRSGRAGKMGARLEYNQSVSTPSMHFYLSVYLSLCIHACMHAYIHTYTHTYIHTCMHAYTHTCIHTYVHTSLSRQPRLDASEHCV